MNQTRGTPKINPFTNALQIRKNVSIINPGKQGNQIFNHSSKLIRITRDTSNINISNSTKLNATLKPRSRRIIKKLIKKRPVRVHNSANNSTENKIDDRPARRRVVVTKKRLLTSPTILNIPLEATPTQKRRRVVVTKKRLLTKQKLPGTIIESSRTVNSEQLLTRLTNEVKTTTSSEQKDDIESYNLEVVTTTSKGSSYDEDMNEEQDHTLEEDNYDEEYEDIDNDNESSTASESFATIYDTDFFILPTFSDEFLFTASESTSQTSATLLKPTPSITVLTSTVFHTKTTETTRLRTYTFIVTRVNGAEQIVTSTTEVKPQVKTVTITDTSTVTATVTLTEGDLMTKGTVPFPLEGSLHLKEKHGRAFNGDEARYNLATRVMSNGVEVIVAGDKTTYPGEPNVRRILSTVNNKPHTLPASTLTDHMMMLLPADASGVAHLSSSLYQNQFVTKTCLTTYTYLTTYLENGSTTVSSHEQVVSNIATEEKNSAKIAVTPTASSGFTLTQNSNLATGVFHTTYTYLYTIMDDEQPLVITSKHTVANTVTAPDDYLSLLQPSEAATPVWDTNTYLSTVALSRTLTEGTEQKIISTKDVITQVVITESIPPQGTSVMTSYIALDVEDIAPTASREYSTTDVVKTYFVTYTYYNTYLEGGQTVVKTNVSTSSDIVTEKLFLNPKKTQSKINDNSDSKSVIVTTPIIDNNKIQSSTKIPVVPIEIFATKTYQTTYTYFTTFLQDIKDKDKQQNTNLKSPIVSSNTRTVENVVTDKIENSIFEPSFIYNLGQSLHKSTLKSIVTTATLLTGEELEITVVNKNKQEIKSTKTSIVNDQASMALPLIQNQPPQKIQASKTKTKNKNKNTQIKLEPSSPSVITGSTIIFFDEIDQIDNLITPTLNTKPSKIKNDLGSLLSSEIVHKEKDQSVAEAQNSYKTSILVSKTVTSNGATLFPGEQVIVLNNKNNSTIIPVSDPNKKKLKNKNKNTAAAKPAVTSPVSNILGSLNINSLTALGPVFNAMAGLIQTNMQHRRSDNTTTTTKSSSTTPIAQKLTLISTTTPKIVPADGQNRSPIYIPVGGFSDEDILESAENQNIPSFDLNLPPQIRPDSKWITEETNYKNNVLIGKPTHESPLVNGGIPISPGQVITANSDVIVGKPAILGPRIPSIQKNNGPHHENETPVGMKPPPLPPKRNWPKRQNEYTDKGILEKAPHKINHFRGSLLNVPAIPLQHYEDHHSGLNYQLQQEQQQQHHQQYHQQQNHQQQHHHKQHHHQQNNQQQNNEQQHHQQPQNNQQLHYQHYEEKQQYANQHFHNHNQQHFDAIPQYTNIQLSPEPETQLHVIPTQNQNNQQNEWNDYNINVNINNGNGQLQPQPTRVHQQNKEIPTLIYAQPGISNENKLKPPVGDPISLPEVIERSTGQHLLVNIQPSQVANVIIPHGSTTALIFGGASEPHKNGQYFDDPSPYPEPETNPTFSGVNNYNSNNGYHGSVYQQFPETANQKPVSGVINVDSQSILKAPPLTFGHHKPGTVSGVLGPSIGSSSGVINLESHIINHDINVHVPPISFGMVNHGDDFTAHIINHAGKPSASYNIIDKDHGEVINEPPPHQNINHHNQNGPHISFNTHHNQYPYQNKPPKFIPAKHDFTYAHVGAGDININVSPQPLPNLKPQEHVVPNGIVLDASIDSGSNKPSHPTHSHNPNIPIIPQRINRPYGRPPVDDHQNKKRPNYYENLTPPSAPTKLYTRTRPSSSSGSYNPKMNPLEIMSPPPPTKHQKQNPPHHNIRTESYPKPITIPLNYEGNVNIIQPNMNQNVLPNNNKNSVLFKPDDYYSGEDGLDDVSEENEDGEVIQESKTRPLRPGQIPYEVLKINVSNTTLKPISLTTTSKPLKFTPSRGNVQTTAPFKKIPSNFHYNPDNPRPFKPAQNQYQHSNRPQQHIVYPVRNKTELLYPPVIKEGIHRHNPYIPFGTVLPTQTSYKRPQIVTPKPNIPHYSATGHRVSSPHFSTSMPIQDTVNNNNNRPFIIPNTNNIHRPTSMPVDSFEDNLSSPKPPHQHHYKIHNVGLQTEEPFNTQHTKPPSKDKTTQETYSFSNKDVVTTEHSIISKTPSKHQKTTEKSPNINRGDTIYKITEVPPLDMIYNNKEKLDIFDNILYNKTATDLEIQKIENLIPPKINATVLIPDIDMKPPKPNKITSGSIGHLSPVFDLKGQAAHTPRPYLETPSVEMKPPPPIVEYTTPNRNEQVMGLSPPPLSSPKDRPVSTHKPILAHTVEISTYRPAFTFPKTTKDTPPYTFETPSTITPKISTTKRPLSTSNVSKVYSRTTQKPFMPTNRPIFRWTKPPRSSTHAPTQITKATTEHKDIYIIQVNNTNGITIHPTTVRKSTTPTMEIIIGHPTISQQITTEKYLDVKEQNRNDKYHYEIKKPDLTKLKPTGTFNKNRTTPLTPVEAETIYTNLYTVGQIPIQPSVTTQETFTTGVHHGGNEIKVVDLDEPSSAVKSTAQLPKAPTQIKESKIILPTKYITHTQTLTVTTTKTTVVKSLGGAPSTLTLLITKTSTSTIVDTVTQTHILVQPTSIVETVTTTVSHTTKPKPILSEIASTYPSFPVQATILHPAVIPTIIHETINNHQEDDELDDEDLDEFIIRDTESPAHSSSEEDSDSKMDHAVHHIHNVHNSHHSEENESIFVVMTDKKQGPKIPTEHVESKEQFDHPHRDEILTNNDVNRVLLGGILIASPPSLESPQLVPPGVSNECRPDCKASRNELCQRVEGHMRCTCRPGFARMFPDRPCKPTYTYRMKIVLYRNGKDVLKYQDNLADQSSPQYISLAAATHNGLDRMVMQSDLRDIYHGVQVNEFERNKDDGIISNFYLQLSDNTDETRLKDVFKKYLRNSNYSLGGTEVFAARELVDDLDALDFDECPNNKYHDCSEHAQCFNLKGTYTCSCKEGFSDLSENQLYPGRICSAELIGCERCHYHGTCYSRGDEQVLCECFQWYAGDNCHINLKVLLIALVTLGAILITLLLICMVLTCVKRKRPENTGLATGMSFLPHRRPIMGGRRTGTLDRRAMIQDSSSEASDTLPYVQKKVKKQQLKGALKKPQPPERHHQIDEVDASNVSYVEQRDRSLTVMIPRAKYHPAPPTSPLLNVTSFEKRKNSIASSNEAKLLSYLDAGPSPQKDHIRRKHSNTPSECLNKSGRKISTGALVSAGFEVSATVCANNMGTLGTIVTTCGTEADRSENATLIQKISADLLSSTGTTSQFTTLRKTIRNEDDEVDNWLDITPRVMTVSEARSYDETTIQPPTKSLRSGYDSKSGSQHHQNDEANTMAERDLGSTFLLPHTHLYKPDRGSDISGFDSL